MVNDNTPMRIVFSNLFAKLIDKHVLTIEDVKEILDASDDEMNAALDKVSEEKNTEHIRIGDDVYVRDADGQGWHTIPAQELSKYSDMSINDVEYKAKVNELEDAIAKCEKAEKEFKSRTCKFRSPINCDFCTFHSDCDEHWKEGEDAPKSQEDNGTKKCPNCGSDLYEHCYMCCYEGEKVKRNENHN